jgi:hypothetical protein
MKGAGETFWLLGHLLFPKHRPRDVTRCPRGGTAPLPFPLLSPASLELGCDWRSPLLPLELCYPHLSKEVSELDFNCNALFKQISGRSSLVEHRSYSRLRSGS